MAGEDGTRVAGWTDCGFDASGKQVWVNLFALRVIEVASRYEQSFGGDAERVTLHYTAVDAPMELSIEHSKQFLIAAGLRQPDSKLIVMPDLTPKLPAV